MESWIAVLESLMAGKAREKETDLAKLTKKERIPFDASVKKEWDSWCLFEAAKVLNKDEWTRLIRQGARQIPSRWVHTNKNAFDTNAKDIAAK